MSFYVTLSWWAGVGCHLAPDFVRLNLGFLQVGLCAWDVEQYIGTLVTQLDELKAKLKLLTQGDDDAAE